MTFRIVDELPEPEPAKQVDAKEYPTKAILRAAIANPERWIEVSRRPVPDTNLYHHAKRLGGYGLHTRLRREGDERALYVRLIPGTPS